MAQAPEQSRAETTSSSKPGHRTIAVANQKGGVGKTTTAVNLAACLAVAEKRTLLVDMDPQANATSGCGIDARDVESLNIYHALLGDKTAQEVIHETQITHLSLMPSHINLTGAEVEMVNMIAREQKLESILAPISSDYDFVILDCPPSLGLLTMFDSRLNLSRQVADEVKSYFGAKVYKTSLARNIRLAEAPGHGQPIVLYDIVSPGAQNYMSLAGEIIRHG